jgi:hypothetical protein
MKCPAFTSWANSLKNGVQFDRSEWGNLGQLLFSKENMKYPEEPQQSKTELDPPTQKPHHAKSAHLRARSVLQKSRWCRAGCGELIADGPLGWWPCCSEACLEAWNARSPTVQLSRIEWPPRQQSHE